MFDNLREDWRTHDKDPWRQGVWALAVYRFGRWRYGVRPGLLRRPLSFVYKCLKIAVQAGTGIDIPCETRIGRRLTIEHFGGIIVSGDSVIGDDVVLRNGVTIGLKRTGIPGAPVIGNRVDIGAGAKILGPIRMEQLGELRGIGGLGGALGSMGGTQHAPHGKEKTKDKKDGGQ